MTMPRLAALAALSLLVPLACLAAPKGKAAIEARCRAEALADHIMADEIDDQVAACVKQTLRAHYAPQIRKEMTSLSHSLASIPLSPTGS